jgi:predicted cupin superfamily sugar epimerase
MDGRVDADAAALIDRLRLEPHPEGGFYREVHRSAATVAPGDGRPQRAAITAIYYLLVAGTHSRWHRVRSDELWCFHAGDPLELFVAPDSLSDVATTVLGPLDSPGQLVCAVPGGHWQAARPVGRHALVSCVVGPGFDFADFEMLRDNPSALDRLSARGGAWQTFV